MRTQTPIELAWVLAWTIAKDCSQNVLKLFAAQVAGSPQSRRLPGSPLSFLSSLSSLTMLAHHFCVRVRVRVRIRVRVRVRVRVR